MAECTGQWYLIGLHGDMVLRVRQGMTLGETEAGELSFDPSCAQLEFGIADDGGLVLSAVDDHELEFAGGARRRHECLARDRCPEIRLPHNVLRLVTDFVDPAQATETVAIRSLRPTEEIAAPQIERLPEAPSGHPADLEAMTPPGADVEWVGNGSVAARAERTDTRPRRMLSPSIAALIVLSGLGFALLYSALPVLRDAAAPEPSATVGAGPAPGTAPDPAPSAAAKITGAGDAGPSIVPLPTEPQPIGAPERQLPAVNAPPATEPERRGQVAEPPAVRFAAPAVPLAEPEPMAALPKPVVQPRVPLPSIPEVAETGGADTAVTISSEPEATVVAEAEERSATTEPATVDVARALFAADQALAQGRLTTPPEANAYTLYSRVLALDPESAEARSGLRSVRQGLINRAMAQLASGALEDARTSLQAAADAGADPSLVTNLRSEVDYRQQRINTLAGQDE